jgi:hypothetical protein
MEDFETFQSAVEGDSSYSSSLSRSLCLVLDEFYKNLRNAGVSAVTGEGIADFFNQVDKSADEYMESYWYVQQFTQIVFPLQHRYSKYVQTYC